MKKRVRTLKGNGIIRMLGVLTAMVFTGLAWASYPIVENFPRKVSGGGSQTWGAVQDSVGRLYFNNKDGLLVYDSERWQLYHMPHGASLRSSLLDSRCGRLYVGSSDEFGYFNRNARNGLLEYHSLTRGVREKWDSFGEVWRIHKMDGTLWFQSDFSIFRYDERGKLLRMRMPAKVTASALVNGSLYVALEGRGVVEMHDVRMRPLTGNSRLQGSRVVAILPFRSGIMAVTVDRGLFTYNGSELMPMATDIDGFLKANSVFSAAADSGKYAFGTVLNGVVIKDFDTGQTDYANLRTGLQNNTVLSLFFDNDKNLWAGLDDGIDLIKINSVCSNLLSSSNKYGAGYMSMLHDGVMYLGTNQGLFATAYPTSGASMPELEPIIRGQIWDISLIGRNICVCSDQGMYYGRGRSFVRVPGISGAWDAQPLASNPEYALVSGYESFHVLRILPGDLKYEGKLQGFSDLGGHFVQEPDGTVWMPHWLRGIYRIKVDPEKLQMTLKEFYNSGNGLPTDHNNNVARAAGQVVFTTEGGIYRFDGNSFHLDNKMSKQLDLYRPGKIVEAPSGNVWCLSSDRITVVSNTVRGTVDVDNDTYSFIAGHLIPGFEDLNFLPDNHLIVSSQEGFLDVNLRHPRHQERTMELIFDRMVLNGDSVVAESSFGGGMPEVCLSPGENTVRFQYILPVYGEDRAVTYSCLLENYDRDWSSYGPSTVKDYTHLKPGDYTMKVRAMVQGKQKVYEAAFPFTVLPPWYMTTMARCVYALLVLALMFGIRWMVIRSWKRSQRKLSEKKEREMEQMRRKAREEALQKDYEIAHLKGAQLEQDVKHKAEELSSLTMNIVRKNEMLLDISNRLKKIQEGEVSPEVLRQINKLHGIIRDNISHDDDWKNFVHNFDEAYEDFTKKLLALHPGLTMVELRTCCYIKMGLSSKDIAPLFNISYRSVEMTRYRLRKKLGLDRSANLYDYLIKI